MPEDVKRSYDASRRQALACQNRARVLDAARRRFLAAGYAATTLGQIAAEADVSVPAINKAFGNKPGLLRALFDVAIVGDDEPVPLAQRNWITAIHEEPDARRKLHMYASVLAEMLPRTAPIQLLIRQASDDPAIAEVWHGITTGRLMGMTDLANNLASGGYLRDGISLEQARDILWTYSSPELYELLVIKREWTTDQYGTFIETGAAAALLPD